MHKTQETKICLVAHNAYGAIIGDENRHIGGVEIQTNLLARWLVTKGYRVSVIVWGESEDVVRDVGGVEIIPTCRVSSGLPGIRFFYPRWSSLWKALRQADADIYYHNCGEYVTGQIALWCKYNKRKFIYSVASDPDCDVSLPTMKKIRERVLYKYGIQNADLIIVQTFRQEKMLLDGFGLKSVMLPMPSRGVSEHFDPKSRHVSFQVLWVGRFSRVKRLDRLLDLAEDLPQIEFHVIGGVDQDVEYAKELLSRMSSVSNVEYHGRIEKAQIGEFYKQASILCCTSDYEGFPNTFLEAWAHGLPIVSTVDPDEIIKSHHLGFVGKTVSALKQGVEMLSNDYSKYESSSLNSRKYFDANHSEETALTRYLECFKSVL